MQPVLEQIIIIKGMTPEIKIAKKMTREKNANDEK